MENYIKPFYINDVNEHTMGASLHRYIDIKLHHLIENSTYTKILVVGDYDRLAIVSRKEKSGKLVNWQRPTASISGKTLIIKCFPGIDYVRHYSSLIATGLALSGKDTKTVSFILPKPEKCIESLNKSGIEDIIPPKVVILGKVENSLEIVNSMQWNQNNGYIWSFSEDHRFGLLGCKFSFWGDIAYHLVTILADRGCSSIIFLGKLGSLRRKLNPNMLLATGNESILNGNKIIWHNVLDKYSKHQCVIHGSHYTLSSVLLETRDWLDENKDYDFVDPEIGHMAKAAKDKKITFSYLHIISDNLSEKYDEDLSNERISSVIEKRKNIQKIINNILLSYVTGESF